MKYIRAWRTGMSAAPEQAEACTADAVRRAAPYKRRNRSRSMCGAARPTLRGEELAFVELAVGQAGFHEVFVLAFADDFAAIHDDDSIGREDGAEAVGDDEGGALVHEAFDGLLD